MQNQRDFQGDTSKYSNEVCDFNKSTDRSSRNISATVDESAKETKSKKNHSSKKLSQEMKHKPSSQKLQARLDKYKLGLAHEKGNMKQEKPLKEKTKMSQASNSNTKGNVPEAHSRNAVENTPQASSSQEKTKFSSSITNEPKNFVKQVQTYESKGEVFKLPQSGKKRISRIQEKEKPIPKVADSKVVKVNLAEKRLANLRQKLQQNVDNSLVVPGLYANTAQSCKDLILEGKKKNKQTMEENMKKTADAGIWLVEDDKKLPNKQEIRIEEEKVNKLKQLTIAQDCYNECEEMEWEPIQEERILSEILEARNQVIANPIPVSKLPQNTKALSDLTQRKKKTNLYVVVDTNVFLTTLSKVESLRDTTFKKYGEPYIVIPWTVIQELDLIKDNKLETKPQSLVLKARKAINFLHEHFSEGHPRILGQTADDAKKNKIIFDKECPDDMIYQTCLQIRVFGHDVVLMTYDKNLGNKALIHGINILGKNDSLDKIDSFDYKKQGTNDLHSHFMAEIQEDEAEVSITWMECKSFQEFMTEAENILVSLMTQVISTGMKSLYGEKWTYHVLIKPPWNAKTVLQCALKHWIAVVNESFDRRAQEVLQALYKTCCDSKKEKKLTIAKEFLMNMNTVVQTINLKKHGVIAQQSEKQLEVLKMRCDEKIKEIESLKLKEAIGHVEDKEDEQERADRAFSYFDRVYQFIRDLCGTISKSLDIPFPMVYDEKNQDILDGKAARTQYDVAEKLNQLGQLLKKAIDETNLNTMNHQTIDSLYHVLTTLIPLDEIQIFCKSPNYLDPFDLYCCLKWKTAELANGASQLQELSAQFCKLSYAKCHD